MDPLVTIIGRQFYRFLNSENSLIMYANPSKMSETERILSRVTCCPPLSGWLTGHSAATFPVLWEPHTCLSGGESISAMHLARTGTIAAHVFLFPSLSWTTSGVQLSGWNITGLRLP